MDNGLPARSRCNLTPGVSFPFIFYSSETLPVWQGSEETWVISIKILFYSSETLPVWRRSEETWVISIIISFILAAAKRPSPAFKIKFYLTIIHQACDETQQYVVSQDVMKGPCMRSSVMFGYYVSDRHTRCFQGKKTHKHITFLSWTGLISQKR